MNGDCCSKWDGQERVKVVFLLALDIESRNCWSRMWLSEVIREYLYVSSVRTIKNNFVYKNIIG
jgi:hypothetical protein